MGDVEIQDRRDCWMRLRRSKKISGLVGALMVILSFVSLPVDGAGAASEQPAEKYSLAKSFEVSASNSPFIKNLPLETLAAQLTSKNADLEKWPALSASVAYEIGDVTLDQYEYGRLIPYLNLTQDLFGKVDAQYEKKWSAMTKKMAAEVKVSTAKRDLYLEVAAKYYKLLLARLKYDQEGKSFEKSHKDLQESKEKFAKGLIAKVDVVRAETNFSYSSMKHLAAENELDYAEVEFITVLNLPRGTKITTEDLQEADLYTVEFDTLKEYVKKNNTELAVYDRVLGELPKFRELVKRINWPTVSVAAFFGEGGSWNGTKDQDTYGLRLTLTQSLYDYGITNRKGEIMELEMKTLESDLTALRSKYLRSLELLLMKFHHAGLEVQQFRKQAEQDMKLAELAQRSYELGLTSFTEMLQSRDSAQKSEYRYAESQSRYVMAELSLKLNAGEISSDALLDRTPGWLKREPAVNLSN
ncbi:MAG: TolC family protein [Proteobacteria bacterium]|nr:TolC family protein [Pseudomonadota bacterium]